MAATETEQEATKVLGLLTLGGAGCRESAMWFNDVADLCDEGEGSPLAVRDALTLLGLATASKHDAESAHLAAQRAIEALLTQYHLAEDSLTASDSEKARGDA